MIAEYISIQLHLEADVLEEKYRSQQNFPAQGNAMSQGAVPV
jgi:hypothetical protein